MIELSVRDARARFAWLLQQVEAGEEVTLLRRGRPVARIVAEPVKEQVSLPDLSEFRASIQVRGRPLSQLVVDRRTEERF